MAGYPKATHCRHCGVEFTEQTPKYLTHAQCRPCFEEKKMNKTGYRTQGFYDAFKGEKHDKELKAWNEKLRETKTREEWLVLLAERFNLVNAKLDLIIKNKYNDNN